MAKKAETTIETNDKAETKAAKAPKAQAAKESKSVEMTHSSLSTQRKQYADAAMKVKLGVEKNSAQLKNMRKQIARTLQALNAK